MGRIGLGAAEDLNKLVIYAPFANDILVQVDLSLYTIVMIDLKNRNILIPDISIEGNISRIAMAQFNVDTLFMATK